MPLYKINSSGNRAADALDRAAGSFSRMQSRDSSKSTGTQSEPDKTVGAGMMAGVGGAAAGATIGSAMAAGATTGSSAGYWGAAIGAVVGIAAYLLS